MTLTPPDARAYRRSTRLRAMALACGALLLCAAFAGAPSKADAALYWTDDAHIVRANLDGSNLQTFVANAYGTGMQSNIVVHGDYLYWIDNSWHDGTTDAQLGRAQVDGTSIERRFMAIPRSSTEVFTLAVSDGGIFWREDSFHLARANLNGSGIDRGFLSLPIQCPSGFGGPDTKCYSHLLDGGLTANGSHLYFGANRNDGSMASTIGRANVAGGGVNPEHIVVGDGDLDSPVAYNLALSQSHIYWGGRPTIGRANLDGSGVNRAFIPSSLGVVSSDGIAVGGGRLYWFDQLRRAIGRANLDGTGVETSFIRPVNAWFLAADSRSVPAGGGDGDPNVIDDPHALAALLHVEAQLAQYRRMALEIQCNAPRGQVCATSAPSSIIAYPRIQHRTQLAGKRRKAKRIFKAKPFSIPGRRSRKIKFKATRQGRKFLRQRRGQRVRAALQLGKGARVPFRFRVKR